MTNLPIPEGELTSAESEELLLMCGHSPGPEPLSPATQAVLDAYHRELPPDYELGGLAAALRAAADHGEVVEIRAASGMFELDAVIRLSDLRAIADELEGRQ